MKKKDSKSAIDNRSNQLNPNNEAYWLSRGYASEVVEQILQTVVVSHDSLEAFTLGAKVGVTTGR